MSWVAGRPAALLSRVRRSPAARCGRPLLLVTDHLRQSGGALVVRAVAERLPAHGHRTRLFVLERLDAQTRQVTVDPSVPVRYATARVRRLRFLFLPGLIRLIGQSASAGAVLVGSEIGYTLLLGYVAARLTGRPFAVLVQSVPAKSLNEWIPGRLHRPIRWVYSHADLVLSVSAELVPEIVAAGVPVDRVRVVPVGVDVDAAHSAARDDRGQVPDEPFILAVGRLVPQKGFDNLIRAFAAAGAALDGHRLVVVGDGPDRDALAALAAGLGVGDVVRFVGFVPNPHPYLARAWLFVLPSRYEGMGSLVLLEAMAHGVPIVATDCVSGPRMLLRDGEYGELVAPDDVPALAAALSAHAADPGRLTARAAGAPGRAREFAPERWLVAMSAALRPLLPGSAGECDENLTNSRSKPDSGA